MKKLQTLLVLFVAVIPLMAASPTIRFTYVPPTGSYNAVTGQVTGVSPASYGVALFINVYGTYWTKPYDIAPITALTANGTFSANITTGGTGSLDAYAEQIVGYVVPLSYASSIPILLGANAIPQDIIDHSVAVAVTNKFKPIQFTNYWWEVKDTGNGRWGPGPYNYFTNKNVTVDASGRLHLKIAYSAGQWRCAEVILTNSLGYGTYRLTLDSDLSTLPPNIVFGFFTWNNYPSYTYREIDVEFSNGDVVGAPLNWQYVVQPYYISGNRTRFSAPSSGMSKSTHTFTWVPGGVYFESYAGRVADQRTIEVQSSVDLANWVSLGELDLYENTSAPVWLLGAKPEREFYRTKMVSFSGAQEPFKSAWLTNMIPPAGGEQIHLNLWLFNGAAPSTSTANSYEVIVSKFEFIPLADIRPRLEKIEVAPNLTKLLIKYRAP